MKFPAEFVLALESQFGKEEAEKIVHSLQTASPHSIRLNPAKPTDRGPGKVIPWSSYGRYLDERPIYTLDPLLHAGAFYVQEASSMFIEQALRHAGLGQEAVVALDLCAAPGGKSSHLVSLLPPGSLLVSNEVIKSRATILKENLIKWGYPNVCITNNDPEQIGKLEGVFDLIVVDAPCSGEGMFRKDAEAHEEWSEGNVQLCAQRQQRILSDIWPALKENGVLIYTTCTFNHFENDDNVAWLLSQGEAENVKVPLDQSWGVVKGALADGSEVYRFLPHQIKGEGLFMAVFRKVSQTSANNLKVRKPFYQRLDRKKLPIAQEWLNNPEDFEVVDLDGVWIALPNHCFDLIQVLRDKLKVIHAGVTIGELKGKDLVPAHDLAVSLCLNANKVQTVELSKELALKYLRKDEINIESAANGLVLLTFQGIPIGWGKKIGQRFNNYYPIEWRIRMAIPSAI